jgi:hypothetical protein
MNVFRWFRRPQPGRPQPFGAMVSDRLAEYLGVLPYGYPAQHHLICCRVDPAIKSALLDRGFSLSGGRDGRSPEGSPTHMVWCALALPRDKGSTRLLFSVALCLRGAGNAFQRDWLARQIAHDAARALKDTTDPCFLIPCHSRTEFPWCRHFDGALRDYWIENLGAYYRANLARIGAGTYSRSRS